MYQHHNRQGADIVLEALKHDPLIEWTRWGHLTVWKIYISIFMRFIANKLGRLLTLGRIFIVWRIFIRETLSHHQILVILLIFTCIFYTMIRHYVLTFNLFKWRWLFIQNLILFKLRKLKYEKIWWERNLLLGIK